ncbi:MAG TPA: cytochrome c peroxidase [Blastocatellia bacterium]|nr:cytochrome c peroxidase [Blastocatellia bacterium]
MKSRIEVRKCLTAILVLLAALVLACEKKEAADFKPEVLPLPQPLARYEAMEVPADNPTTPEKAALGRQLFFDKRLSGDESRSCYSCHVCEKGLTDGLPKAIGAFNKQLPRSSPTLWNIGYHKMFYWDGRSPSLEKQAMAAWTGGNMGAKDHEAEIVAKINGLQGYRSQFQKVFGGEATADNIMQALSAFERTIISGDTAWDRWQAGDQSAVSAAAKRGWDVFKEAKCNNCHDGVLLTDQQFHNVGIGMDVAEPDKGRFNATKKDEDAGAFKTPTLRDISKSAPYFHDGSVATLEDAIDLMLGGGKPNQYLDKKNLEKRTITGEQRSDLLEFLKSLSVDCRISEPPLPQK